MENDKDILCDKCKKPLKDFEILFTIRDKEKLCTSCTLNEKKKQNES